MVQLTCSDSIFSVSGSSSFVSNVSWDSVVVSWDSVVVSWDSVVVVVSWIDESSGVVQEIKSIKIR